MNYLKHYCNLIRKAEKRTPPEGYIEKHHTFPKSIFGKNNRVVVLTAREHYIAHLLLVKIYIKRYGLKDNRTIGMMYAYNMMSNRGVYNHSILYETFRKKFVKSIRGESHPMYGRNHTEDTKIKMRKSKNMPPRTKEHNEKLRRANIGKIISNETREKLRKSLLGKNTGPKSQETKNKISQSKIGSIPPNKGKPHSEETKIKIRDKKCKYEYIIISPCGIEYKTNNLKMFCREYTKEYLSYPNMCKLSNDNFYNYKMWKVNRVELVA
jgi:hypothetical protein